MTVIVIRHAEVHGVPGVDVRLRDGRVDQLGRNLSARDAAEVIDAHGGALIPGLHDHHLHLHAIAADATSTPCGPPTVRDRAALAAVLAAAPGDEHGWVRGTGYVDTVAGDLDAPALDALYSARPVRIQHRSGAMWILNTAALAAAGISGPAHPGVECGTDGLPTGRIWRADPWLRTRLPRTGPPRLDGLGATLTGFGITGVTDATPDLSDRSHAALVSAVADGDLPQRVSLLGAPLGSAREYPDRVGAGPYKIVLADSGLPLFDHLVARIRAAHADRRAVAVHCVTREALVLLMAALEVAGSFPGDRIEHAAIVPADIIDALASRGVRVVTQPGFLAQRGSYYRDHLADDDLADLYRCRTLLDAGVGVALSSDAPYGPMDPWAVIAAAVHRRPETGEVLGPGECLSPTQALDAYLAPLDDPGGPPRRIRPGGPADLVLLHEPLRGGLAAGSADVVRRTFLTRAAT
ncbi:amidohydrolase family protein [Nocardia sp. NPDC060259]|uniref:amidohydrolase family protein n=1 Tax=Nocardia sp. NPDC060259 TaxID=3347088 RepID=UPI00365468D4